MQLIYKKIQGESRTLCHGDITACPLPRPADKQFIVLVRKGWTSPKRWMHHLLLFNGPSQLFSLLPLNRRFHVWASLGSAISPLNFISIFVGDFTTDLSLSWAIQPSCFISIFVRSLCVFSISLRNCALSARMRAKSARISLRNAAIFPFRK